MQLKVAGRDRVDDLGAELSAAARALEARAPAGATADDDDIAALGAAADTSAYLAGFVPLLRVDNAVNTEKLELSPPAGLPGRLVLGIRAVLWKLVRPYVDWVVFRQNAVNAQTTYGLEFANAERERQVAELQDRLARVEAEVRELRGADESNAG